MNLKTISILVLTFSFFFSGCTPKNPEPIVVSNCPVIHYHKMNVSKPLHIEGRQENGEIVISKKDFKKLTSEYLRVKGQVKTLQSIIDSYNGFAERSKHHYTDR